MYSHSPFSDSLSAFTPRIGSLCNAVTPGDFRSKPTTKHVKSAVIIPEYDDMEQDQSDHGMIHSNSNLSLSSASSDQDIDVDVDIDDDDMMSTSSPSTSESSSPVSSYDSPRCTPIPSLPTSPCAHRTAAPISRPWSGCLSCDQPHLGRECTQTYLVHLAVESMRPSGPSPIEHICTSSCTHHHQQKHYAKPAFLKKMTLNPAGFIRIPLPETSADLESTQLGQRRLMTPVPRTSISVNVADTPKMGMPATPASKSRKSSVFTFTTPVESTTQAAPTLVNETPRLPRRSSITPIHGVSQSFVPILSTLASPRIPSHALLLTPVIDTTSQLDISIEVPTVISPIMYARQQPIHRTVSMMDMIQQEERCVGFMSPPLPSSAVVPAWHTKAKHRQAFHHVLPPIQPKKYHGVLPTSNSSISSLPSTWTQPKLMMLYAFYMFLNAAFVILLHH